MRRAIYLAFVFVLSITAEAETQTQSVRVFAVDPSSLVVEKLPIPVKSGQVRRAWTNEDVAKVFEVNFGEPVTHAPSAPNPQWLDGVKTINHFNAKSKDGFVRSMKANRTDLRGLPFLLGDDCRTELVRAKAFGVFATVFRGKVTKINEAKSPVSTNWAELLAEMNEYYSLNGVNQDVRQRASVAALMQIVMPESAELQISAAKYFASISHADATRALARMSVFSFDERVRAAAVDGLKNRLKADYADVFASAFHYPLPAVAQNAADAVAKLNCQDLLPILIDVLDQPDPRLPRKVTRDGREVSQVRELVKANHLRNCFLCHAPGNMNDVPKDVLKAAAPVPGEPLPTAYYSSFGDLVVRVDTTYLRQDFSLTIAVANAKPWPEKQRFDFFVRTRELTNDEVQEFAKATSNESARQAPYHRSALYALRELTGRDAEPTAEAWRKLLKLPRS